MRPRGPNREDHRDSRCERRGHEREQNAGVDDAEQPAWEPAARRGEREQEAEGGSGDADERGEQQAVPERADLMAIRQDGRDAGRRERAMVGQHPHEQHRQRIDDEQGEQQPQREHRRGDDGIPGAARGVGSQQASGCAGHGPRLATDSGLPRSSGRRCACGSRRRNRRRSERSSHPLQHFGEARLQRARRIRGHEVDLVLRELVLHRGRGRPVDELLAELRILGALDESDALGRGAMPSLRRS